MTLPKATKAQIRSANTALSLTTGFYRTHIPVDEMAAAMRANGMDASDLAGIYTGREGRSSAQVAANAWLTFTWYRMEVSGRYEIVAYVS